MCRFFSLCFYFYANLFYSAPTARFLPLAKRRHSVYLVYPSTMLFRALTWTPLCESKAITCSSDLGLSIELRQVMGYLPDESAYQQSRPPERHTSSSKRLGRAADNKQQQNIRVAGKTEANHVGGGADSLHAPARFESELVARSRA